MTSFVELPISTDFLFCRKTSTGQNAVAQQSDVQSGEIGFCSSDDRRDERHVEIVADRLGRIVSRVDLALSAAENRFSLRSENDENERPAKKSPDGLLAAPSQSRKTKSPQIAETNAKRRTTRRTTIRVLQENGAPPPPAAERTSKTRYATRYSTRLAGAMVAEEMSIATTTTTRRTTRLSSE